MSAINVRRFDQRRDNAKWCRAVAKITQRHADTGISFDHYLIAASLVGDHGEFNDEFRFEVLSILFRDEQYQTHRISRVKTHQDTDTDFMVKTNGQIEVCMLPHVNSMGNAMEIAIHCSPGFELIHEEADEEEEEYTNSIIIVRVELDRDGKWIADAVYDTADGIASDDDDVKFAADDVAVYSFRVNIMHIMNRTITGQLERFVRVDPVLQTYFSILSPRHATYLNIQGGPCMVGTYSPIGAEWYRKRRSEETGVYLTRHSECLAVFSIYPGTGEINAELRDELRWEMYNGLETRNNRRGVINTIGLATLPIAHLMPQTYNNQTRSFSAVGALIIKAYPRADGRADVFLYQYSDGTDEQLTPLRVFHYILSNRNVLSPHSVSVDALSESNRRMTPMLVPYEELLYRRYGVTNDDSVSFPRIYHAMASFKAQNVSHEEFVRSIVSLFNEAARARARALMGDFAMWRAESEYFGDRIFYGIKRNTEENSWTLHISDDMSDGISAEAFDPRPQFNSTPDAYDADTDIIHASSSAVVSWPFDTETDVVGLINIYVMSERKQREVAWEPRGVDLETVYAPLITAKQKM